MPVDIAGPEDVEPAFSKIAEDHGDGVVLGTGSALFNMRAQIGASAITHKLPAVTYIAEEAPYGLLLSYGQDFPDYVRRAAVYVDKILQGAKPADLPVEQPTTLKMVVNLKTAKALGLTIPSSLLTTADEVIEQLCPFAAVHESENGPSPTWDTTLNREIMTLIQGYFSSFAKALAPTKDFDLSLGRDMRRYPRVRRRIIN